MKRLKQYSFWEYMRVLLVFIAGLAVSLLVFSYNVQVRTEQNVEELLDYNIDQCDIGRVTLRDMKKRKCQYGCNGQYDYGRYDIVP